jgi:hypothetical protein
MNPLLKECIDKHLPKISKISYHGGVLILVGLVIGFNYSFIFLTTPPQFKSVELNWRFNMGFSFGLIATIVLLVGYIVWLISKSPAIMRCYKQKLANSKKIS